MSLYRDYCREREGIDVLETEKGFCTYHIKGDECYISEIYVVPKYRKDGYASYLADTVANKASENNCKYITGSVDPSLPSSTDSMKVLLAYGMKVHGIVGPLIYFIKEL